MTTLGRSRPDSGRAAVGQRTILTNAMVFDGEGGRPYRGGVVIENDVIVDVGPQYAEFDSGVDMGGRSVAPGIIDMHTHSDVSALSDTDCVSAIWQGITTQIVGHCGFSAAPTDETTRKSLVREEPVFGFPTPEWMRGRTWGWSGVGDYLAEVSASKPRTNIGTLVGHNTLRRLVLGSGNRQPAGDDLHQLTSHAEEAISQGALGVSSGLSYSPGVHAQPEELAALAAVAGRSGRRYHTHMRYGGLPIRECLREAIKTGQRSGTPVNVSHLYPGPEDSPDEVSSLLEMIDDASDRGNEVTFDLTLFTRGGGAWAQLLPSWALDGGLEGLMERLADTDDQERLEVDIARMHAGRDWDDDLIVKVNAPDASDLVGKTIGGLAREWGIEPPRAAVALLERDAQAWIAPIIKRQGDLDSLLKDSRCVPVSDGMAAHPTRHAHLGLMPKTFGTFPLLFGDYVRSRGVIELAEAVARVTSLPADRLGIADRGRLSQGKRADLFVFEPDEIANTATDDRPGEPPDGITDVMVNGEWAIRDGRLTAERNGRALS